MPAIESASGRGVPDVARQLFGNVRLEFEAGRESGGEIASTRLGAARFTHLAAQRHLVIGGDVLPGDCRRDLVKVMVQKRGRAELSQGRHRVSMEEDQLVFYDPAKPYEIDNIEAVEVAMLHLPRATVGAIDMPVRVAIKAGTLSGALYSLMSAVDGNVSHLDPQARQSLGHSMAELARAIVAGTEASSQTSAATELVFARMKQHVEANLASPGLDAASIARHAGCSVRTVYLAFSAQGTTPADYIWRNRIERAARALKSSRAQPGIITDIAYAYGFSSSAHFARKFRETYSCSPSEWLRADG